ncbi:hypothetical protein IV49_GL001637 [Kandleria vitulina DSM 20405]|uniref:Segregation and condensation protein A n=2 Tax=Coprobacillaceae TaxID=2810280 RepID=A0A0R2HKC4_9FIRM|nr:hypothetical protein IV49_GL001637 [Kandleria vitulina DSM 20405]
MFSKEGEKMEYQVKTEEFTGPLDLLLHLIKEKNMDLLDLDVSIICDQYLAYIETMDPSYLEAMSEYLVMAAWLIEMKSRLLLPKEHLDEEDDYEEKRQEMIRKLIEKNQINEVIQEFEEAYNQRQMMFSKMPTLDQFSSEVEDQLPDNLEVYDLISAMQKILKRKMAQSPLESKVARVEISIAERCEQIETFFSMKKGQLVDFEDLFDEGDRYFAVVTFLSVLVLVKNQKLVITQEENFDRIYLKGKYYE